MTAIFIREYNPIIYHEELNMRTDFRFYVLLSIK